VTLSVPKARLRTALAKGLALKVSPGEAGQITATVKSGRKKVGSGKTKIGSTGKGTVKSKFTRAAKRSLRRKRSLKLTVSVVFKPSSGGPARRGTATATLRR
jgi:hypothetical protein